VPKGTRQRGQEKICEGSLKNDGGQKGKRKGKKKLLAQKRIWVKRK